MDSPSNTVSFDGQSLRLDTAEQAEVICKELESKHVEVLILQGNTFGIEAAERVGIELSKHGELREAHFKDLFTSRGKEEVPEAMKHLLKGISDSGAQLTLLDLSDNAVGPIGAPSVIEFLNSTSSETLKKLYLNNCGLGPEGSSSIATTIPKLRNLCEFICGRNRLENKGATNMSRALSELQNLQVLKVNQNGIRVEGIKELVKVLEANYRTIREFDFSDNTIKAEGCEAISKAISIATNLRIIHLDDALLENDGFSIICDALTKSPSLSAMDMATFEGNELHGSKIVDLIELTFANCKRSFTLNLLENEFTEVELTRLNCLAESYKILVDDINSDDDDDSGDDEREEGEIVEESELDSNGYVDLGNIDSEMREVSQDFIKAISAKPYNEQKVYSAFLELVSTGKGIKNSAESFHAVQILCEELGLMKSEETRKRKPLERDAIVYVGKKVESLPSAFRDFFEVIIKNNDDLGCGKILFEKLEI